MARFFVLNNVFFEGYPAEEEHLKSSYLVFSANFFGDLNDFLHGMWGKAQKDVKKTWQYCVGFKGVNSAKTFAEYMKKCQVKNALFFNGSTDDPLAEQLKSLYLKQEFSRFVYKHQGVSDDELRSAFKVFLEKKEPANLEGPTWPPGYNG